MERVGCTSLCLCAGFAFPRKELPNVDPGEMLLALLFVNSCGAPGGQYCRVDSFLALLRSPTVLLFSWLFKSAFKSGEKWTDA